MSGPYLCDYYCERCKRAWMDASIKAWTKAKPATLIITNRTTGEKSEHSVTQSDPLCPQCGNSCRHHYEGDETGPGALGSP